jgi:tetratricopeptide (TPR) repeat protein
MMRHRLADRLILTATLALLAGAEPPRGDAQGVGAWVGLEVILSYGAEFKADARVGVEAPPGQGPARTSTDDRAIRVYRVKDINGPRLRLVPRAGERGPSGWVQYTQVVHYPRAIEYFTAELRKNPAPRIYVDRARCRLKRGETSLAMADLDEAIRLDPGLALAHSVRGAAWRLEKRPDRSLADLDEAIRLDPKFAEAYLIRAIVHREKKEHDRAIGDASEAIRLDPEEARAYRERGLARAGKREFDEAVADFSEAIRLDPKDPAAYDDLAWLCATCPEAKHRDGPRAVQAAARASALTDHANSAVLDTLAAAYAEAGDFARAVDWQQKCVYLEDDPKRKEECGSRLKLYREKTPYRSDPEATASRPDPDPCDSLAADEDELPPGATSDESAERRAEQRALGLGLRPFRTVRSEHFVAVGNAPEAYLRIALHDCEAVARDYLDYYSARGFAVAFPDRPMAIVVLEDERAFARFLGLPTRQTYLGRTVPSGPALGVYDRKRNWLVLQDFRNVPASPSGTSARGNHQVVLAHEVTHQLTFNSGLLDREGDLPNSLVEGLAAYGEVRRPYARSAPGQLNRRRLDDLAHAQRAAGWIPVRLLLTDESWRNDMISPKSDLVYAEGWLLTHYLMSDPENTRAFRKYLDTIRIRRDPDHRLDDARAALGDLDALDVALRRHALTLLKQP